MSDVGERVLTDVESEEVTAAARQRSRFGVTAEVVLLYVICIGAALTLAALLVAATGGSWTAVYRAMLDGSIRNPGRWGLTLAVSAPILLVGLGTVVSGRAGLVNIGQEGQLVMGASFATFVAARLGGPGPVALVVILAFGVVGGAIWAGIAGVLRYWRNVPEVLTTLLLTTVAANLMGYGLRNRHLLLAPAAGRANRNQVSEPLPPDTRIPRLTVFGNEFPLSVLLAVGLALVLWVVLGRSVVGFRLRMLGRSPKTAHRAGVGERRFGVGAMVVSGGFAGLAGGVMLAGGDFGNYQLVANFGAGIGYAGLLAALVARQRVIVLIFVAFVFGSLRTGSGFLRATGVSGRIADVVQGLLVLALLLPPAILYVRERRRGLAAGEREGLMGDFLSALGDLASNESAYRNAAIAAVVLLFAASGELVAERAGTINISLEGMMLAGVFAAAVGVDVTGSTWAALAAAAAAGFLVASVQANMSHRLPADQFVVGLVLNVLVLGVVGFLTSELEPQSSVVRRVRVPVLSEIPLVGPALFDQPWVLYLVYPLIPFIWWLLYRTRWGLEVRAVGEDPNASDVSGLHVNRLRRQTIYLTGALAGIGGGYFLFARSGRFEDSLIGGRGYIAIAAVIFGGWTLKGTVGGCVLFGLVGSFALTIPSLGYDSIDPAFLAIAPAVVTIVAMGVFAKRVRQPAALARPFVRGLK